MALQKKYFYSFKAKENISYLVEIWQNTTNIITPEEIRGDNEPFKIEYPTLGIFEPVKGSGCEINIVSTSDKKFLGLYTADMFEYQIRLYQSSVFIWCGYLDSELYSEPFNIKKNYTVTVTGSDGFNLLERLNYLDSSNNAYTGITTQFEIIKTIITKLSLPYKNIYFGISTICNDFSLTGSQTIFHKTYVNNKNWYNEDNEPETCRKVLEETLKTYGCYIIQNNGNLYITDKNTITSTGTTIFKKYDSSFNYINDETINPNLGDISNFGLANSDLNLSVEAGYNKQVILFSPYTDNTLIDYDDEIFTGTTTDTNFGTLLNTYTRKYWEFSDNWTKLNANGKFCEMVGTNDNINKNEKYLVILPIAPAQQNNDSIFEYKKTIPDIVFSTDKKYYLKIDASCYVRTLEEVSSLDSTLKVSQVKLKTNLTIGNKRYRWDSDFSSSKGWYNINEPQHKTVLSFTNVSLNIDNYTMNNISDQWINLNTGYIDVIDLGNNVYSTQIRKPDPLYIPIPNSGSVTGNTITFSIGDYKVYNNAANRAEITTSIKDLKLKDFKITIVDEKYNTIEKNDIEYIGTMNKNYKSEATSITLFQGSSSLDSPIEKGSLMGLSTNYFYLNNWTRKGKTDSIENLLLRSYVSNYTNKRYVLTGTLNQINNFIGTIKYQNHLPDKKLMIQGITNNLEDNTSSISLIEITEDNLDINKSF